MLLGGGLLACNPVSRRASPQPSECAAAIEVPTDLAVLRGAYGYTTASEHEGFPCELLLAGDVAVRTCSPGDPEWGELRLGATGPEVVLRFDLRAATLAETSDPTPQPLRLDGAGQRALLGTTCWAGPTRGESFERLATPVVGVWQRIDEGHLPRRLWIGPHRWRDLESAEGGVVELVADADGARALRRDDQVHPFELSEDRSRLTLDGIAYRHERGPQLECDQAREVAVGSPVTLRLEGEDPDGGPLMWRLRVLGTPKGSAMKATPDEIDTTFVPDVPGEFTFLAKATDDEASETFCHPWVVAVAAE